MGCRSMCVLLLVVLLCTLEVRCAIDEIQLQYDLLEEATGGLFVGNVGGDAFEDEANNYAYSIDESLSDFPDSFTIEFGGLLETTTPLDRDTIPECILQIVCEINLIITAFSEVGSETIDITITILDINDNVPIFPSPETIVTVAENAPLGTSLQIDSAIDPDSPENSISEYALLEGAPVFSLVAQHNIDNTFDVFLVLEQPLDREETASYPAFIAAYDITESEALMSVVVVVTDVNDNAPIFTSNSYDVTLSENQEPGSIILQVSATDADEGQNAELFYSFTEETNINYGEMFVIDDFTGDIRLNFVPSFTRRMEYNLVAEARDISSQPLTASVSIFVVAPG